MTDRQSRVAPGTPAVLEESRAVRTELRLAANHIVSFAELVLEECEDGGDDELVSALSEVRTGGREVVDKHLSDPAGQAEDVGASARRVLEASAVARRRLAAGGRDDLLADMGRIEAAARRLRELVGLATEGRGGTAPEEMEPGGPGRVLIVDDDPMMREVLARRLRRLGHIILEAEDGLQALETLRAEPVDLVLTDLRMPGMNGTELLERLQADPALREVPAIMISGAEDSGEVIRAIELGAEDFLPKPFDPTLLRARVGASLEKKRLRDHQRALLGRVRQQAQSVADLNAELEGRVARQVEEISRLSRLQRFLSPQVAELVVSRGDAGERLLESHRREVAVLFCDLRGFTAFSEIAEPEDVLGVLREFHGALGQLVHGFEATVGDFTGDGMMVFFNDPIPIPDPAGRAVGLAVAMRDRAGEMLRSWRRRGHELGFSAGVSFGYATLGQIGFEGRYDYGVVGNVVNLAARLCAHATDGQILLSRRAYLAAEEKVVAEDIGRVTFKGLRDPASVYSLVELKGSDSDEEVDRPATPATVDSEGKRST